MSDPIDPFEERRLRLEQAEREARGDFSMSGSTSKNKNNNPSSSSSSSSSSSKSQFQAPKDDSWRRTRVTSDYSPDTDESNPNAVLNRQHANLRAQAKITLGMAAMLDTSQPREEARM